MAAPSELEPTPVESRIDFMVSVEFYGVVKIYNPVRENFLRKAAGQEVFDETADPSMGQPVAAAAPAAQPDATPEGQPVDPAAAQPAPAGGDPADTAPPVANPANGIQPPDNTADGGDANP